MRRWLASAAVVLTASAVSVVVASASAAVEPPSQEGSAAATITPVAATASVPATKTRTLSGGYALDFTLPTYGKSGCLVCHGDPKLVVSKSGGNQSFFIDANEYKAGAHGTIQCPGCHVDYGYKAPHNAPGVDWRLTAKQACKNCHKNEFREYSLGTHAARPVAGGRPDPKAASKPLCGDCHPGHGMKRLKDDPAAVAQLHASGGEMCGREGCHKDYWDNYDDYWHGAAYHAGAGDAPACWDCHGAHTVLPSADRNSPTNVANIGTTCGKCHQRANESYESYLTMIHGKKQVMDANPIYSVISGIASAVKGFFKR